MASPKKPQSDQARPSASRRDQKPIPLNDLIPKSDVRGGRQTVFGVRAEVPSLKKKPQK